MKYDVIIIGSGLGGLECALILSRQGEKVLVLERQKHPGGCIQSYHRKGASYDTGLHYVGGLAPGQPLYDSFNELGLMELPWKRLDPSGFDEITICGKTYKFAEGYQNFVDELAKSFPAEREGLENYVQMLQTTDEEWLQKTNAWDYLNSIIHNPLLISIVSGASLKMELRKRSLPLFTFAHGNASFIESSWRLCGPGNLLVKRLIAQIRELGGELITGADVIELKEADGRITKAICSDGKEYFADTFISDVHPARTISLVKDSKKMKRIFRMRISSLMNTYGMFTLQLRLKPDTLKYFNHDKFVYSQQDVWDHIAVSQQRPSVRGIMISCPVPTHKSDNHKPLAITQEPYAITQEPLAITQEPYAITQEPYVHVLDIMTPMRWDFVEQWADKIPGHRGEDYVAMKEEVSRQCIALAETVIPNLSSMIEDHYTSTPLTYYTYNNSPAGTAYGLRKDFSNPLGTILSPKTPLPNLFLTGQSLMLHGLHGVTMTAKYTCSKIQETNNTI